MRVDCQQWYLDGAAVSAKKEYSLYKFEPISIYYKFRSELLGKSSVLNSNCSHIYASKFL